MYAHSYLEAYNEKIIVWDRHNKDYYEQFWLAETLSFDEWHDIFKMEQNGIRKRVDGEILEMHMQEEKKRHRKFSAKYSCDV